jgi:hypothetical protein
MKEILLREEFVTIYFDSEYSVIFEEWTGVAMPEEFQKTLTEKLSLYQSVAKQKPQTIFWMANLVGMRGLSPESVKWANEVFHPQLFPAGIRKIAYLIPEPVFYELSDDQLNDGIDQSGKIQVSYFTDYEEAVEWLNSSDVDRVKKEPIV